MTKQLFIYENPVPVNAQRHGGLSIRSGTDWRFAASINSCPLMASEFTQASRAFPIVFTQAGDETLPVAVMGLRNGENVFVSEDGAWQAEFMPAFLRQYPFVLASADGNKLTLCIDETYPGCNSEGRGERLFDAEGVKTAYLERMFALTQQVQQQFRATQAFGAKLRELGLLRPMRAAFKGQDAKPEQLGGFLAVDRKKLADLDGDTVSDLHRSGALEAIYAHLFSMGAFGHISDKLRAAISAQDTGDTKASVVEEGMA